MGEQETIQESRSYHLSEPIKLTQIKLAAKSDLNFQSSNSNVTHRLFNMHERNDEYYKKYEHDEVPVKDSNSYIISKSKDSISNSNIDLDNLEERIIHNNVSQELQTDENSFASLDSNIKFFKTTVEKIFANFFTSMKDFEQYKKRFNDIIAKSKEGSVGDMEDFIKDMFEHILSSENSLSSANRLQTGTSNAYNTEISLSSSGDAASLSNDSETRKTIKQEYLNQNYPAESTVDNYSSKLKTSNIEEIYNIFLVAGPSVEIKLNNRNMLSEILIRKPKDKTTDTTASADDLKLAAKKLEVERYIKQAQERNVPDIDIPVKISFPKKNIHLNEDFACSGENGESSKSFLTKICSMLCKRFRKNTIG